MSRWLPGLLAAVLATAPLAQSAAAGSDRAVLNVTARVVQSCSVALPRALGRGAAAPRIDHRCSPGAPHRVSVARVFARPVAERGRGRVTLMPGRGGARAGRIAVVTVTY